MIQAKGIDDLLAAGGKSILLEGEQMALFLRSLEQATGDLTDHSISDEGENEAVTTPQFPLEAFPIGTRKFVTDVAASVGCPVDFAAIAAIAVAASAIGAARSVRAKEGWEETPIFFAVAVALSGAGKSPAFSKVTAPLFQRANENHAAYKQAKHEYLEALRHFNKKGGSDDQCEEPLEPPPESQVVVQDITSETISMYLDKNPKGFLAHVDELIGWLGSMDKYRAKGNDRQFWLSLWNGAPIKKDRVMQKGESLFAPNPYVSVLGGVLLRSGWKCSLFQEPANYLLEVLLTWMICQSSKESYWMLRRHLSIGLNVAATFSPSIAIWSS
jgi:hypothetical protein